MTEKPAATTGNVTEQAIKKYIPPLEEVFGDGVNIWLYAQCIDIALHILYYYVGGTSMSKSTSISIRIDEDELEKIKIAAKLEAYSSYSEFIRRTALLEAARIMKENNEKNALPSD